MGASATRKPRLSRSADFDRVYRHGKSAQHRLLVLYRFDRPEDASVRDDGTTGRVGITVSRKIGNAVTRNLVKRKIRAVIDELNLAPHGIDLVAIARPGIAEAMEANEHQWLVELIAELGEKLFGKGSVVVPGTEAATDEAPEGITVASGSDEPITDETPELSDDELVDADEWVEVSEPDSEEVSPNTAAEAAE